MSRFEGRIAERHHARSWGMCLPLHQIGSFARPFLEDRILVPILAEYDGWTRGDDNMPHLPWGSQWVPRHWIKYGELVRMGGYLISALILGIGFLMIAFSADKRGLHDRIAGTYVGRRVG